MSDPASLWTLYRKYIISFVLLAMGWGVWYHVLPFQRCPACNGVSLMGSTSSGMFLDCRWCERRGYVTPKRRGQIRAGLEEEKAKKEARPQ